MIKLSVLIPAYNPGKWLRGILDVLKSQIGKYPDTEIIVVDDGSDEDLSWVADYPNVVYERQPNRGEPSARNHLLKLTHGEYIQFIDADDEITSDFINVVYENIREGWDWISFNWTCDGGPGLQTTEPLMINCAVWAYTFRTNILRGYWFDEKLLLGCDVEWLHRVLKPEHKHKHDERVIYNYRWGGNEDSLCHRKLRGEFQ